MIENPVSIDVRIEAGAWKDALENVSTTTARALNATANAVNVPHGAELSVLLTDDAHQRELNRNWRDQDASTNVLSFPAMEPGERQNLPPGAPVLLGDIVVAFETTEREARDLGKSFADHFCHLLVHGMLHVVGFDHETDTQADEMEPLEIAILGRLGIPSPYPERTPQPEPPLRLRNKDPMPR